MEDCATGSNCLNRPPFAAYAALVAVCFFWGTTYLAIRMALESFPPLLLVSGRFVLSGSILLAGCLMAGMHLPKPREFALSAFYGIIVLGGGNGCLTYSERIIPSSLAALFIAVSPFWLVGIEALMPDGESLRKSTLLGMLTGLAGAALLVGPDIFQQGFAGNVWKGFLLLQLGSVLWSYGSIKQKYLPTTASPIVQGAIQQLAAGLAFTLAAASIPEGSIQWSFRGVSALLYLVTFGSIVGYSAYLYALSRLPVSLVSIYTYINPIVAAVLGWLFYREPFGKREALAMAVIFVGVAIVKRGVKPKA